MKINWNEVQTMFERTYNLERLERVMALRAEYMPDSVSVEAVITCALEEGLRIRVEGLTSVINQRHAEQLVGEMKCQER